MKTRKVIVVFAITLLVYSFANIHSGLATQTGFLHIGVADQGIEVKATIHVEGGPPTSPLFTFHDIVEPPYPFRLELGIGHYTVDVNYTRLNGDPVKVGWTQVWIETGKTRQCAAGSYSFMDDKPDDPEPPLDDLPLSFLAKLQEIKEWLQANPFWWWLLLLLLLLLLFVIIARKDKKKRK